MDDEKKLAVQDLKALWEEYDLGTFEGAFRSKTGEVIPVTANSPNELIDALTRVKTPVGATTASRWIGPGDT
ncbi:MAG: hypothetical protein M3P51_02415 [Chloroflexota bacterium]|nr:hypothetical protein [Chloroflexota bacterium]